MIFLLQVNRIIAYWVKKAKFNKKTDSVSKVWRYVKQNIINKQKRLKPKKCFIIELIITIESEVLTYENYTIN